MAASGSREEVLADFQACTGIDNVGEAILHLEDTNWNLLEAVNRVLSTNEQPRQQAADADNSVEMIDLVENSSSVLADALRGSRSFAVSGNTAFHPISADPSARNLAARASSSQRLSFLVTCGNRVVELQMLQSETLGDFKIRIHAEFSIPPCRQEFIQGWEYSHLPDTTPLSTLELPSENSVVLLEPSADEPQTRSGEDNVTYVLKVAFKSAGAEKNYDLNFTSTKTIHEVKQDLFALTDVPVRDQLWTGWPTENDSSTLGEARLSYPVHLLQLTRKSVGQSSSARRVAKKILVDLVGSDSSDTEDFEDASESLAVEDDIFVDEDVSRRRVQPLVPDDVEDDTAASIHFQEEFGLRYGDCRPMFFPGTLEEAMQEAFNKPVRERKLLAIYIHHDGSVLSNVFCTQLLCAESVVTYLSNHFIIWGWDVSFERNRARLLSSLTRNFSSVVSDNVRTTGQDRLPMLMFLTRTRSANEVVGVVHGNVCLDELMTDLLRVSEVFSKQQQTEIREEEERQAREMVKREQDEAYRESLRVDRAKEEAKKQQEEQRAREEMEERQIQEAIAAEQQEMEEKKEALRRRVESGLPSEPSDGVICQLKVRLPNGSMLSRNFRADETVQVLFDYLLVQGYSVEDYKLLTSWPRKDVTTFDSNSPLQSVLHLQEMLTLEER